MWQQKEYKKYIIGCSHDVIRPLCILLHQMIVYYNCFDVDNMSFVADDKELLK